jgi:dipeptidyl aminopeptidase/acylaminoacyl peptidase
VDAVAGDWGGAPFVDMRIGWGELLKQYPAVDPGRAAAIGGSWGGYGVNLIQGHPEWKFGFKALVSHCGEFNSTYSGYSVDEQTIVSDFR